MKMSDFSFGFGNGFALYLCFVILCFFQFPAHFPDRLMELFYLGFGFGKGFPLGFCFFILHFFTQFNERLTKMPKFNFLFFQFFF